ncbi:MAG: Asp-tRNA(Asn)/Glu-tRNA(Gln) amidotransferase subunit GatB [Ectothiorhodospiraceae bacterium AqS1]|nr:Asp-tRNA(Asn)/Glu-tRNA(Gln) amidotransferase subunit GatB [Ectothiorhodospiraceae bacterium AqS1]MBF2759657.1 Asp-tRNA(Asn)/Glu-tRNA(Gln) amidotransferase subunit GatB [Ectothiorhodospiraceae bacterium AqS1]
MNNGWEAVIGLEIHAQLATRSKIFSGAPTAFGASPNRQACLIDLGFPGVLPVLNAEALRMAVIFGLAIGAKIAPRSVFARKNYFYPDLPKGYQISQYELPVVEGGAIEIEVEDGSSRRIGITRAHLEEDAGKSLHDAYPEHSGIDLNRAGIPLLEIVSEPDMRSPAEAVAFMRSVHALVRHLGICDGNMQEGSFRCDANISVRRVGDEGLGTRTELKNINSFRFVGRAAAGEIERQIELLESGGAVIQQTRLYDARSDTTRAMRGKEEANDYRYFPDPDLLPIRITGEDIARIRAELPELPAAKKKRLIDTYDLEEKDAGRLTADPAVADYYENILQAKEFEAEQAKLAANWLLGELTAALHRDDLDIADCPIPASSLATLIARIHDGTLSGKMAKTVFEAMWGGEGEPDRIIEARGLAQISDSDTLEALVDGVIQGNPEQVSQYRSGKEKVFGFLVGQVMKASRGQADPKRINEILRRKLSAASE